MKLAASFALLFVASLAFPLEAQDRPGDSPSDRVVQEKQPGMLWSGTYSASYLARATTSGSFVRPPVHAEEMYNPAVHGRSDGGRFTVRERPR
jgi:uncharacterized protein YfaS (alpha-2-macroglobulin family)